MRRVRARGDPAYSERRVECAGIGLKYLRSIGSNGLKYTNKGMYTPPGGEGGCPAKLVYLREKSYIFSVLKDITFPQKCDDTFVVDYPPGSGREPRVSLYPPGGEGGCPPKLVYLSI